MPENSSTLEDQLEHAENRLQQLTFELKVSEVLDHVRKQALEMNSSEELHHVVAQVFQALKELALLPEPARTYFCHIDKQQQRAEVWMTHADGTVKESSHHTPLNQSVSMQQYFQAWIDQAPMLERHYTGHELKTYLDFVASLPHVTSDPGYQQIFQDPPDEIYMTDANFRQGNVGVMSFEPLSEVAKSVLKKFAQVFELTFTRFLDLERAEAQAREAQIEAALERVRAASMAMHKSKELNRVVATVFDELKGLGFQAVECEIILFDPQSNDCHIWPSNENEQVLPKSYRIPYTRRAFYQFLIQAWKTGTDYHPYELKGRIKSSWEKWLFTQTDWKDVPKTVQESMQEIKLVNLYGATTKHGILEVGGVGRISNEQFGIIKRFAKVFEQSYTRFLDIKKAEAQAREAQIEAALERVRARTMAMHDSNDIADTVLTFFKEITGLDLDPSIRCGVGILSESEEMKLWTASRVKDEIILQSGFLDMNIHPLLMGVKESWEKKKISYSYTLDGDDTKAYFRIINNVKDYPVKIDLRKLPGTVYQRTFIFPDGVLYVFSETRLNQGVQDIFQRFAKVFGQAYTRHKDLVDAEARAREAQIEAALERVRAASMAMHKSEELVEVATVLHRELRSLKVHEFSDTSIVIFDESNNQQTVWGARTESDYLEKSVFPLLGDNVLQKLYDHWQRQESFFTVKVQGSELEKHIDFVFPKANRTATEATVLQSMPDPTFFHCACFSMGYLELMSDKALSDDSAILLTRFAKVFDQTYTRFLDLQKAEAQAREAQIEAAIERIRASSMAMNATGDISKVVTVFFHQLKELDVHFVQAWINVFHLEQEYFDIWFSPLEKVYEDPMHFKMPSALFENTSIKSWREGNDFSYLSFNSKEELNALFSACDEATNSNYFSYLQKILKLERLEFVDANYKYGTVSKSGDVKATREEEQILQRFAKAFEQTYTRFLDLQKAEAQAREAEIEVALERIRASSMAMHKSEELPEVALTVLNQIEALGIPHITCSINIVDNKSKEFISYSANIIGPEGRKVMDQLPRLNLNDIGFMREALKRDWGPFNRIELRGNFLDEMIELWRSSNFSGIENQYIRGQPEVIYLNWAIFNGLSSISLSSENPLTEDQQLILVRMANTFSSSYTRFLDLQKAEAQAREAQIEAALEKVRSRTMAMQKSEELSEAATILFQQLRKLGGNLWSAGFVLLDEENEEGEFRMSNPEGEIQWPIFIPNTTDPATKNMYDHWKKGSEYYQESAGGHELKHHYDYLQTLPRARAAFQAILDAGIKLPEWQQWHAAYFSGGYLLIITLQPYEEISLLKRFAKAFQQTYTRFLDLQKAEAQARESQIEAALERVRSRTMGMHASSELSEVATVLFQQIYSLGFEPVACAFIIVDQEKRIGEVFISADGTIIPESFSLPYYGEEAQNLIYRVWESGAPDTIVDLSGNALQRHLAFVAENMPVGEMLQTSVKAQPERLALHIINFEYGFLGINFLEPREDALPVLHRFAKVFEQTYTRFLDLQKAELQAQETQIELALERVRARSMAMHQSIELSEVVTLLFKEIKPFGFAKSGCELILVDEQKDELQFWLSSPVKNRILECFNIPRTLHPFFQKQWKAWKDQQPRLTITLKGQEKVDFDQLLFTKTDYQKLPEKVKELILNSGEADVFSHAILKHGLLEVVDSEPISEEQFSILERFAKVFEQAYTRFLDLQKAEEQTREAQIEAALERVRASTMAMHHSKGLVDVVSVTYEQLIGLGAPIDMCVISLKKPETDDLYMWIASPEQTYKQELHVPYFEHPLFEQHKEGFASESDYFPVDLDAKESGSWYQHVFRHTIVGELVNPERRKRLMSIPGQTGICTNLKHHGLMILNFSGYRYSEEEIDTILRFSRVFEQAYVRFLDLQKAEAQAREAEIEAALERVRASAMAMHTSEGLSQVAAVLREQLTLLGQRELESCLVQLYEEGADTYTAYYTFKMPNDPEERMVQDVATVPWKEAAWSRKVLENYHAGLNSFMIHADQAMLTEWYEMLARVSPRTIERDETGRLIVPEELYYYFATFSGGFLSVVSYDRPSNESQDLLVRAASTFNIAYRRYLDLVKAEAQAHEAQIEAALERVRAKTMAMHRTEDLREVVRVLYEQISLLHLADEGCNINIFREDICSIESWMAAFDDVSFPDCYYIEGTGHPFLEKQWEKWREQAAPFHISSAGKELKEYSQYIVEETDLKRIPDDLKEMMLAIPELHFSFITFKYGQLEVVNSVEAPSQENIQILNRFAKVFEQTYTRFLDLQKAEEQTREAQVEAALEKVRSASMAMHSSDELKAVVEVTFNQLLGLNLPIDGCQIQIIEKGSRDFHFWSATPDMIYPVRLNIPYFDHPNFRNFWEAKDRGDSFVFFEITREETLDFYDHAYRHSELGKTIIEDRLKAVQNIEYGHTSSWSIQENTGLFIFNFKRHHYNDDENSVLHRFSIVFEQAFTRFLDLQKAEAQVRKAQIEASLERIRAKAMAMHNSEDISEATIIIFQELERLGITTLRCGILIGQDNQEMEVWTAVSRDKKDQMRIVGKLDMTRHAMFKGIYKAWTSGDLSYNYQLKGRDLIRYYKALDAMPEYDSENIKRNLDPHYFNWFGFGEGGIFTFMEADMTPEFHRILTRFASVFSLTYRRYLDLVKAESQAREAQVEASLEKIRGRAMAMQKSDELREVVGLVSEELNISLENTICIIMNFNWKFREIEWWSTGFNVDNLPESYKIPISDAIKDHPLIRHYQEALKSGISYTVYKLEGEVKRSWDDYIFEHSDLKKIPVETQNWMRSYEGVICNEAFMSHGVLEVDGPEQLSDEKAEVLQRFAKVVDLTYKRIEDLQQAEARAVEAVKQATLDRVRGEIASMRRPEDLDRITPLIWKELTNLQVPFFRCGVFIIDDETSIIHAYLSTPTGESLAALELPFDHSSLTINSLEHWRNQQLFRAVWDQTQFEAWADSLLQGGYISNAEAYRHGAEAPEKLVLHYLPFTQGMLYVGSLEVLDAEQIELVEALARAFSIAYARYEDFRQLEQAKGEIESALSELKAAQDQLIHAEKMASLGELTAGIAHEIQNPLNFVNNFSEVSTELAEELSEMILAGDQEEAEALIEDICSNLEKIAFHGRRAEGIVKSMLQHSRSSSGVKESTDINALCDEYVRLAYHGMRARDKSFQAQFELRLEPDLPRLEVVPQDIGRVVLNLVNNAFQAIADEEDGKVMVSTHNDDDGIYISVKDNGPGIADEIRDKIFQPFFTTKPTGQGTGLGLSMSFDILTKGHGGSLNVTSEDGGGAEFTIFLPNG